MEWWSRRGSWLGKAERQWRSKGRAKAPRSCWSYARSGSCAELMVIGSVESEKGEAKDQSLFVAGINDLESEGGDGSADQIRDNVDPNLGQVYQLHHADAHGYCRIERPARNGANRECVLVGGGYYYFDAGYWFPAWGYNPIYEFYDYDGPIYTYGNLLPDEVIVNVQRALNEEGYYAGGLNGSLNSVTRQAIANYQYDAGLIVNGIVDAPTVASLGLE